jgi:hypothetical protein
MKRIMALGLLVTAAVASTACTSGDDGAQDVESSDSEVRTNKISCKSPRLTAEGYRWEGSFIGNDGQVNVTARVCIQDDDDCSWAQCDAEEGGGDFNGGPRGDWYGFWDTGAPMRGPCTVKIGKASCPGGGGGGGGGGGANPVGQGKCSSAAHGVVSAYTCMQEADWKWYQCQKDGVILGAYGPESGPLGACAKTLWFENR